MSIVFLFVGFGCGSDKELFFPLHKNRELQVQFWINVFTRYSTQNYILHDTEKPERIYQVLYLANSLQDSLKEKTIQSARDSLESFLIQLGRGKLKYKKLSPPEKRIYRLFGRRPSKKIFLRAAKTIRVQQGMCDRFYDGLLRSGLYIESMRDIFKATGLPEDLVYLAHVESSFNPLAVSKYGAVGMWQITKGTGSAYLKINNRLDERKDPFLSTVAAARILKDNYEVLQSWPLAITAYNHGVNGMRRATENLKTRDFEKILKNHESRLFGVASKNFYFEFLAAKAVAEKASAYFGELVMQKNLECQSVEIRSEMTIHQLRKLIDVRFDQIVRYNPALSKKVLLGHLPLPKEYWLRLPDEVNVPLDFHHISMDSLLVSITSATPEIPDTSEPVFDLSYLAFWDDNSIYVQSNETLGHYAQWLEISAQAIRKLNAMGYHEKINIGQKIRLPLRKGQAKNFIKNRQKHHQKIQGVFFQDYELKAIKTVAISKDETLWHLARVQYEIPVWLLIASNGLEIPKSFTEGDTVYIPIIKKKDNN